MSTSALFGDRLTIEHLETTPARPRESAHWETLLANARVERMPPLFETPRVETTDGESVLRRQREAERWAALLATAEVERVPELPLAAAKPVSPPVLWQVSDGSMTPARAVPASSQAGASLQRLRFDVHAGDLGELTVIVERDRSGVRVLVGAESPQAFSRIGPERAALVAALRASGIALSSVRIVRTKDLGTVLAQSPRDPAPNGAPRRRTRGLSLKG